MPQVGRQIVHRDQDAACQQIRDHQRSAVIRDMLQPDACLVLHIFHRQMTGPAYPGRTVTDFVEAPSFAVLDELSECAGGEGDDDVPGFVEWIAALDQTLPRGIEVAASNPCGYDFVTMDNRGHIFPPCFERPRCR